MQRPRTMLYGARRRVWPGIPSSSRCTRKNSGARGLIGFTRSGRKTGYSGAPWNRLLTPALIVPSLDVPVPQMVNQLLEVCRQLDTPVPEQVIEVPKISSFCQSHRRRVRFAEQTAEQLVEVPTIISYSSLRGIVEQNVDIPVPRGRGRVGLGLHPGQSSTANSGADLLPAATAEQNVDIPVPRGGRLLHPASSSSGLPGTANQAVFSTFPRGKKVRGRARTRGRNCSPSRAHPRRRLSWRVSSRMQPGCGCSFPVVGGNFWARVQKSGGLGEGWDGASSCVSPRQLLEAFPDLCARAVRTWNLVHYFSVPVSGSHCSRRLGVAVGCENWIFREMASFVVAMLGTTVDKCFASVLRGLWKHLHISYVAADSISEALLLHSV